MQDFIDAMDIKFSDFLSIFAISISVVTFYFTLLLKRSRLIIKLNINPSSFQKVSSKEHFDPSSGTTLEVGYNITYDVIAFTSGNASMYLESVRLQFDGIKLDEDELNNWYPTNIRQQLEPNSVKATTVQISSERRNTQPNLSSDPNSEVTRALSFTADVYTPDGYLHKITIPVMLTMDTDGGVKKVTAKPQNLKYHSLQWIRWLSRKLSK